ncbi:DUF4352 domain-containing protein [Bacillus sp. APMAM]|nr:DUF4352 domain-containing protein [Bacillus sp. APMAM]
MLRFIWQNWWRHKERFILLLIGALIISSGLSYLVGLSETNKGTIVDTLQKRWSASYDIVVRPHGSRSVTEEKHLLEPNYLSGLSGGISMKQYEKIKALTDVEVAAPIAMIGYANYDVNLKPLTVKQKGLYRVREQDITDNGVNKIVNTVDKYFPKGNWDPMNKGPEYGVVDSVKNLSVFTFALLAGIDPEQEAKLVGLDKAVIKKGKSRYFNDEDNSFFKKTDDSTINEFPVIVSNQAFVDKTNYFTIERLDLPFQNSKEAETTMKTVKMNGGDKFLDTIKGTVVQKYTFTGKQAFDLFVKSTTGIDFNTGKPYYGGDASYKEYGEWIVIRPSPLKYNPVTSPYPDRWPFAYEVKKHGVTDDEKLSFIGNESFRIPKTFGKSSNNWPRIKPNWIGFYDPSKLKISQDPTTELPMETYRPATADLVLDKNKKPVNPAKSLKPTDNPFDFLASPPVMLTTIEAAQQILGDKPISSIRVKVAGVKDLSEESQKKLEKVAKQIEDETGLITDITLGSSPQPTLTHAPAISGQKEIGWLQQPWVKIGSSISIFREAKVGFSEVIGSVIVVAIIYVWASSLVSLLARRKEFAVLLAIGWRPNQLAKLLFLESVIVGSFVAIVAWIMLGTVFILGNTMFSPMRFILTGLFGLLIYLLGAIIPAWISRNISPYETMNTGEISKSSKRLLRTRGLISMAFNHLVGKWKRSFLSIIAIALPTSFLAFFLFITFRLKGVMYTTWLGQYVALEVGPMHYTAMAVALVIAILTTVEIMWQNISERSGEIALLNAVGWRNGSIRFLILAEGLLSGIFAGIIGLALAIGMMWGMYHQFPTDQLGFILLTAIIPVIVGLIGAILPAEKAVRISPSRGIVGQYSNRKATEKRLKWALALVGIVLMFGLIFVMIKVAPKIVQNKPIATQVSNEKITPTTGKGTKGKASTNKNNSSTKKRDAENGNENVVNSDYDAEVSLGEMLEWWVLTFKTEKIDKQPSNLRLTKPQKGNQYLFYKITFTNKDNLEIEFNPFANFTLQTKKGDISPTDFKILKSKGWNDNFLDIGGNISAIFAFEVPNSEQPLSLLFKSRYFHKGLRVKLK